jgi:acetyl-CoA carboxylase biotin carboxyl carrier protein
VQPVADTGPVNPMDLLEIKALIDAMAASDLAEMEVAKDGWTLRLVRRAGAAAPRPLARGVAEPAGVDERPDTTLGLPDNLTVRAPLAGTVHLSPSPGEPAFVAVGQTVKAGANLCVIEAMKMFNAVTAERDGTVEAVLVTAGDEVEAGQPLLRIA